jgi:hypothetical protein
MDDHLYGSQVPLALLDHHVPMNFASFLTMHAETHDMDGHAQLYNDLLEHLQRL